MGSGAAAYSAAILARHRGAEVIMVEKAPLYGGTTLRSGGLTFFAGEECAWHLRDAKCCAVKDLAQNAFKSGIEP